MTINRHGLSRHIPADVARRVRQECGFGCVLCGNALFHYEHFDPPFEDATEHSPEGIALVCGGCHDPKTRGLWSKDKVAAARAHPKTFQQGCARGAFDITAPFTLWIGNSSFNGVRSIVRLRDGTEWLSIDPPEADGAPVRLFAEFHDGNGAQSLVIARNEWNVYTGIWDAEVEGPTITVRSSKRDIALQMKANPPHSLTLTRLQMARGDLSVRVRPDGIVTMRNGISDTQLDGCVIQRSDTVLLLE